MKLVKQKHELGCVSACVAMVAGISYDEAMRVVLPNRKPKQRVCATNEEMFKALNRLGINYSFSKAKKDIKSIKNPAILTIVHRRFGNYEHVVVWDGHQILDPFRIVSPFIYYQNCLTEVVEITSVDK